MDNIQIFNNPEFGDIRTIIIDGEPWFVGNDCAKSLGYKNLYNGVNKNVDEEDRRVSPVGSASGIQQTTIINESGLYSLIFGSKLESAKKFKKWVTSEVLPSIRKTGAYGQPKTIPEQIKLLAQGTVELNERVDGLEKETHSNKEEIQSVKDELNEFKEALPLMPQDADEISGTLRKRGVEILGGKQSTAYNDRSLRMKLYRNFYSNLKYNFNRVSTYKAIKRNQKAAALKVIAEYKPPLFLQEQIDKANAKRPIESERGAAE